MTDHWEFSYPIRLTRTCVDGSLRMGLCGGDGVGGCGGDEGHPVVGGEGEGGGLG